MLKKTGIAVIMLITALVFLGATPVTGQQVDITVHPDKDVSRFHSYAWGKNMIGPGQTPEERKQTESWIVDAVNQQLEKKGYREAAENPDFLIRVEALALPGDTQTSANFDHRMPSQGFIYESNRPLGMGVSIWLELLAGVGITASDAASGDTLWDASLVKKYKDPDQLEKNLQKEIKKVFKKALKKFPSSKKRS